LVAGVDRAIAKAAQEIVVLADHTKVGVDTMVQTVPSERIDRLVTDDQADPAQLAGLREAGVDVTVCAVATTSRAG